MKAILHVDKEWGIGKSNALMFRIPEDMKFFKQTTVGNVVVLGANTLKSFPNGKPLKDRVNIVFYPHGEKRDDCTVVGSLECPDCGKKINVFGQSRIDEVAAEYGLPVLARLPIDPRLSEAVDAGHIEGVKLPDT